MFWNISYHITTHYSIYIPRLNELYIASRSLAEPVDQVELLSFTNIHSFYVCLTVFCRMPTSISWGTSTSQVWSGEFPYHQVEPVLAQRDQPDRLGDQEDHQDGKADLRLHQGLSRGSGGTVGLCTSSPPWFPCSSFSSGVPAQGRLHRAHDPQVCRQLRLGAERVAGGDSLFPVTAIFFPLSRSQEVRTKGFSAWMS